ncbi:MAG: lipase family protein [archaeon]|nr:lipase family protein [archaeon]
MNSSHGTVRARVAKKWRPLSTHTVADAQGRVLCSLDPTTRFRVVLAAEFQALCGREEGVAAGPGVDQTSGSIELLPPLGVAGGMYSKSQPDSSSPMRGTFHQSRAVAVHPLASFLKSLSESPRLAEPLPGNPLLEAANERIRLLEAQLRFKDLQLSRFPVKAETDLGFFTEKPPATCIGEMHKHPRDLYLPVVSWMAYLAAMAYLSPVSVRQVLYDHWPQSGLPQPSSLQFFSNLDTDTWAFGYCYPSSKEVVIAFRGTVSDENWSTNLDIKQCPISPIRQHYPPEYSSLLIHQGFNRAFLSIWPEVLSFIQRNRSTLGPNTRFAICGHSLGGALASLCFLYLTAFFPDIQIDQGR